jgi:hypothetical protein
VPPAMGVNSSSSTMAAMKRGPGPAQPGGSAGPARGTKVPQPLTQKVRARRPLRCAAAPCLPRTASRARWRCLRPRSPQRRRRRCRRRRTRRPRRPPRQTAVPSRAGRPGPGAGGRRRGGGLERRWSGRAGRRFQEVVERRVDAECAAKSGELEGPEDVAVGAPLVARRERPGAFSGRTLERREAEAVAPGPSPAEQGRCGSDATAGPGGGYQWQPWHGLCGDQAQALIAARGSRPAGAEGTTEAPSRSA